MMGGQVTQPAKVGGGMIGGGFGGGLPPGYGGRVSQPAYNPNQGFTGGSQDELAAQALSGLHPTGGVMPMAPGVSPAGPNPLAGAVNQPKMNMPAPSVNPWASNPNPTRISPAGGIVIQPAALGPGFTPGGMPGAFGSPGFNPGSGMSPGGNPYQRGGAATFRPSIGRPGAYNWTARAGAGRALRGY